GIPRVNLSATQATPVVEPAAVGETETVTVEADLGKPLDEEVTLHVMIAETSTAVLGTDFTYGHRVYELDEATGEQSAPEGAAMPCPEDPMMACDVTIPAGVTRFDIEASISMTMEREVREFIDFQVEVSEEDKGLLRGSFVERVTIEAHGNEIMFATNAPTTLMENDERTGIQVTVSIDEPSPTPITLNVATRGTATAEVDYNISGTSLTIPANADSASLTLTGINNNVGEGSKTIELMLSGDLPTGWTITDGEHEVTLQDDDLAIFFTNATPGTVEEPDSGSTPVTVTVDITQAPMANITVRVADGGTGQTAQQGNNNDYTFSAAELTFASGSDASQTTTLMVLPDNDAETDQTIILTLADVGGSVAAEGSGFSLGGPHTITIPANDNTVAFASGTSTLAEGANTMRNVAVNVNEPAPVPITLNVDVIGTMEPKAATEGTDYENLPDSLTIGARQSSGTITLRGREDELSEGNENIMLEISMPSGSPLPSGWTLGSQTTHTVTLQDNDLSIGFERSSGTVNEPGTGTGPATHTVNVTISSPPPSQIRLNVELPAGSTALTTGLNPDVTYSPTTVIFEPNSTAPQPVTFTINDDSNKEPDEHLIVRLSDTSPATLPGTGFSIGTPDYRLNIPANDNIVSIDSDNSDSTVGENGGTANVVVKIDGEAPANDITLNVSRASSSTAMETRDFTFPATLTIPGGSKTGMITVTGVDNSTEQTTAPTIVLNLTGTLPTGYDFTPSDPLTHTITINDDERGTIGWTMATDTHTALASGGNVYEAMVTLSKKPTVAINLRVDHDSRKGENGVATQGISQDYIALAQNNHPACTVLTFLPDDQSLTRTCTIWVTSAAAGKVIVMELEDRDSVLAGQDITLEPAVLTITVNSP
ncbi:MAG: hypothetical protein OXF09_07500, partial [Hyphomicrobiales bacterium]|nr:hypothetical protein [Hyphomicrobiales bacterium]